MKKYLISTILIFVGILCLVSFNIIGSEVATDGTLTEPFFLIPLGFLSLILGILTNLVLSIKALIRKPEKLDKLVLFFTSLLVVLIVSYFSVSFIYLSQIG
jgi:hypothetical protein